MTFPCIQCGLCCMNLHESELYADLDRGDGVCRHYDVQKKNCLIYDERPLKCRIDDMYDAYFSRQMTKEEYYKLNREACNALIKQNKQKEGL